MEIVDTYSVRDAESLLRAKGALEACLNVARRCSKLDKQPQLLHTLGFEPRWGFDAGGNRPRFSGYSAHWKVGIIQEMREQMNIRSRLLFTEIAHQKGLVEVAVFILPVTGQGTFDRTVRELTQFEVFTRYFPLQVPVFLIGCER